MRSAPRYRRMIKKAALIAVVAVIAYGIAYLAVLAGSFDPFVR